MVWVGVVAVNATLVKASVVVSCCLCLWFVFWIFSLFGWFCPLVLLSPWLSVFDP
ncbi:uncharacterized protein B0P05DRAFT_564517, partial [Gilbertella persicaria]|uniref:uncharacterized protein n=1 Tax=Gilbertella persicaria TaxID=101096 RepID=UPI00221FBC4D